MAGTSTTNTVGDLGGPCRYRAGLQVLFSEVQRPFPRTFFNQLLHCPPFLPFQGPSLVPTVTQFWKPQAIDPSQGPVFLPSGVTHCLPSPGCVQMCMGQTQVYGCGPTTMCAPAQHQAGSATPDHRGHQDGLRFPWLGQDPIKDLGLWSTSCLHPSVKPWC